jgi:hypothetical protein
VGEISPAYTKGIAKNSFWPKNQQPNFPQIDATTVFKQCFGARAGAGGAATIY